jgi:hypothetical protein
MGIGEVALRERVPKYVMTIVSAGYDGNSRKVARTTLERSGSPYFTRYMSSDNISNTMDICELMTCC